MSENPCACETTVVLEVEARSAMLRQSIVSGLPRIVPKSVRSYRLNDTEGSNKLCAVLYWTFLITELFRSDADRYDRKIVELIHCYNFDKEITLNKLKSVTLSSELV